MQITFRHVCRRTLVEVFLAQDWCLNWTSSSFLQSAAVLVQGQPGPAAGSNQGTDSKEICYNLQLQWAEYFDTTQRLRYVNIKHWAVCPGQQASHLMYTQTLSAGTTVCGSCCSLLETWPTEPRVSLWCWPGTMKLSTDHQHFAPQIPLVKSWMTPAFTSFQRNSFSLGMLCVQDCRGNRDSGLR